MIWTALRVLVFCLSLLPFFGLVYAAVADTLGADPAQELAIRSGEWALRFLLLCLSVTPLREITGLKRLFPLRKMLGLYTFFYASLHFTVFIVFVLELRWGELGTDILERPYVTVGFAAFLILLALALTSNRAMMRRLGRNWKRLHRLIYAASVLALVHLIWILRSDITEAVIYGTILFLLLGYRAVRAEWFRRLLGRGKTAINPPARGSSG